MSVTRLPYTATHTFVVCVSHWENGTCAAPSAEGLTVQSRLLMK